MNEDTHTLNPTDRFCLQNAEVLHMLQKYQAAEFELSHISPEQLDHPEVLHLRCRVYWGVRNIAMALSTASRFIEKCVDDPFGYVFKAQMLAYDGRPKEGY